MKLLFVYILLILTECPTVSLANSFEHDEDINKGNLYRREEFNNKNESEYNKNVCLFYYFFGTFPLYSSTNGQIDIIVRY